MEITTENDYKHPHKRLDILDFLVKTQDCLMTEVDRQIRELREGISCYESLYEINEAIIYELGKLKDTVSYLLAVCDENQRVSGQTK
jgi:hypothetical protein